MAWQPFQTDFFNSMWPHAQKAGGQTGIDPRIIFAQSALESNWGRSAPNNNYFGIKGPGGTQLTREFLNGKWVTVNDSFRGYGSMADSVQGWVSFITGNKRYKPFLGASGIDAQLAALGKSGYATDPNYTSKLKSIIKGIPSTSILGGGSEGNPLAGADVSSLIKNKDIAAAATSILGDGASALAAGGGNPVAAAAMFAMGQMGEGAQNIWDQIVAAVKKIFANMIKQTGEALQPWISRGAVGILGLLLIAGALIIFAAQSGLVGGVAGKVASAAVKAAT